MRLTTVEVEAIRSCARRHFGEDCTVRLFGSRTDDTLRGGDIDLHIETETPEAARLDNELRFREDLIDRLGEPRIDVIVRPPRLCSSSDRSDCGPYGTHAVTTEPEQRDPAMIMLHVELLRDYLAAANKIARRLSWSRQRISHLMPLDAKAIASLSAEEEERLDAFLLRFNSLTAMIQDRITRAVLKAEEEDLKDKSKKDQRLLMEKLGALDPQLSVGTLTELRNRIALHYPDDGAKQAKILKDVYHRSTDLLGGYASVLAYADVKFFAGQLGFSADEA